LPPCVARWRLVCLNTGADTCPCQELVPLPLQSRARPLFAAPEQPHSTRPSASHHDSASVNVHACARTFARCVARAAAGALGWPRLLYCRRRLAVPPPQLLAGLCSRPFIASQQSDVPYYAQTCAQASVATPPGSSLVQCARSQAHCLCGASCSAWGPHRHGQRSRRGHVRPAGFVCFPLLCCGLGCVTCWNT
jgi:hypothetical protein